MAGSSGPVAKLEAKRKAFNMKVALGSSHRRATDGQTAFIERGEPRVGAIRILPQGNRTGVKRNLRG